MDIIHLTSNNPKAVENGNQYLRDYSLSDIRNDEFLSMFVFVEFIMLCFINRPKID